MSTPAGDVWIIGEADEVQAIAEWFDRTVEEPRYVRHAGGHAIAVAFSCEADEVLFDLTFPQFRRAQSTVREVCKTA